MPILQKILPLMAGMLAPWLAAQAQPATLAGEPWRLVHPQAKWILGVDWGRARNSAAAQVLQRQFPVERAKVESAGMGLGALTSVGRIIASGVALQSEPAAQADGMLVAIEGKIDRGKLKRELPPGTAMEKFRGADLFVPPKAKPDEPLLAVVGDTLMLIGDRKSLSLILSGRGGASNASLAGSAAALAADYEIWLAASAPPGKPSSAGQAGDPLQGLEDVQLGISLREGLRLTASLKADSEQSAQGLAGLVQFTGMMGGEEAIASWIRKMRVEQRGKVLAMTLDVPAQELEQGIEMGKQVFMAAGKQALGTLVGGAAGRLPEGVKPAVRGGPGVVMLPAAAPEPKLRTIRIVGAEDGTREIHYTAPGPKGN